MQSFSFVAILLVALSAFAIAHTGEEYALPTAIGVSVLSNSFSATGTVMIWQGVDATISSTLQPNPTGSVLSSAVSFIDSILTDSLASPTRATSSITTPTTPLTSTVILASLTSVSSSTATLVSPTNVYSTTASVTRSSALTTTVSTTTAAGSVPTTGVGFGGLLVLAAGVLVAL